MSMLRHISKVGYKIFILYSSGGLVKHEESDSIMALLLPWYFVRMDFALCFYIILMLSFY